MLRRTVLLGLFVTALVTTPAHAGVQLVKVGSFNSPVYVTGPPGDASRLFVVEQDGTIRVVVNGQKQATPFLNIAGRVTRSGEQGLLSMAFAPDYATSGSFFVYYTSRAGCVAGGCDEQVSEFKRSAWNPNVASSGSERPLMSIPHPNHTNHNGGQLQLGPDGYLYISTGDGGGSNDAEGNAQLTDRLLGKILRIDPFHGSPYSTGGNPFSGALCNSGPHPGSSCPEVWSWGLRNPWRFSFDRATGDMIIGDVGQAAREEIDLVHPDQSAGANFGWPCVEGDVLGSPAVPSECAATTAVTAPVHFYAHSGSGFNGKGIIGGYVVRDPSLPDLYGRYLYGDLSASRLRSIVLAQPTASDDRPAALNVSFLSSFGEDAAGHVYAASVGDGGVWRIADPSVAPLSTDTTKPRLRLKLRGRQHVLKRHAIKLGVTVDELSTITAGASVNVQRAAKVLHFKRVARNNVAAGRRVTLKLKLSRSARRKLRRAFRHRKSFRAKVTLSARDAAGNRTSTRRPVRLLR